MINMVNNQMSWMRNNKLALAFNIISTWNFTGSHQVCGGLHESVGGFIWMNELCPTVYINVINVTVSPLCYTPCCSVISFLCLWMDILANVAAIVAIERRHWNKFCEERNCQCPCLCILVNWFWGWYRAGVGGCAFKERRLGVCVGLGVSTCTSAITF